LDFSSFHGWLRASHIGAGFLGLGVFWLPLLVRKGGRLHVVCGWAFVGCAAVVIATALVVCGWRLIDPIGFFGPDDQPSPDRAVEFAHRVRLFAAFLGAVAVYTLVPLVLAVRVVRTRWDPDRLEGPGIRLLIWSEAGVSVGLVVYASALLVTDQGTGLAAIVLAVGFFGLGAAWWHLRFVARPRSRPMFWWYKHMEFMLTTGIGFHTAFAVFGLKSWLGALGTGPWAMVPWVLPSAVGIPAVWLWVRHYGGNSGR
jgi:hypothetical protein